MKILICNISFFDELYFISTNAGFYKILFKFAGYNYNIVTPSLSVLYRFNHNFKL